MSVASMTGFARQETSGVHGTLVCEIRSVNHRFLDLSIRLPESCRAVEAELRQSLSSQLRRGKVDCTIQHRPGTGAAVAELQTDEAALNQVLTAARRLVASLPDNAQLNVLDLLRWPGVLREDTTLAEKLPEEVRALFAATLAELSGSRRREGDHLAELITQRCSALEGMVAAVKARLPEVEVRVRRRLEERLQELNGELNRDRVEQEIVLLLQRLDVAEELDRLTGHIAETRRTLVAPEPAGRRLDFLLQEFNREANTLSSKSQDLDTTRVAVEMKVLIEQMREQVQNIE
jgi:uncharacterized protein (TIGR00255 family)